MVTDAGEFYHTYLRDLAWRIEHPGTYTCSPLADILSELSDAGLELEVR